MQTSEGSVASSVFSDRIRLPAMINPLNTIEEAQILAQAIVNTIPEPFIVLDGKLRVLAASRSFYEIFQVDPQDTQNCLLYDLGDGQWDIPALRLLLETIIPERTSMDGFEVSHDFPGLGRRIMLLNARKVLYETSQTATILLAFRDVTEVRAIEHEKALLLQQTETLLQQTETLLRQKKMLLQEMQHRVANSLQIIASILLLKAGSVTSEETRHHLEDAHQRVMSVAAVQLHLDTSNGVDQIEVRAYLTKLCGGLAASMIGENAPMKIGVIADEGMIESTHAVSLGLIVTELLINAIKYAFPGGRADALIRVGYAIDGANWTLTVSDNGVGKDPAAVPGPDGGLGTTIVKALAKQLDATLDMVTSSAGLSVIVTHMRPALPPSAP